MQNKFISNEYWHFYTNSNFFLSILHSLKLEKTNYNNEVIKSLLKHFTGFEITLINTSHLINLENNDLFVGLFHHETSIGSVRKKIECTKELFKLNITTSVLKNKDLGLIKLKK